MIEPQVSTAIIRQGSESRTAGYMPVFGEKKAPSPAASAETFKALADGARTAQAAPAHHTAPAKAAAANAPAAEEGGILAFLKTVIDVINPLQHIPVLSTMYRHLTGDEISAPARIVGDTLYGGPIGTMVALADVTTQEATGRDVGGNVLAMLSPSHTPAKEMPVGGKTAPVQMAAADIIWDTPAETPAMPQPAVSHIDALAVEDVTHLVNSTGTTRSQEFSPQEFSPSFSLSPLKSGGTEEAGRKSPPALSYKTAAATKRAASAHSPLLAVSPALLSMQETLADNDRMSAPPGWTAQQSASADLRDKSLISARMMEGLDKYRAMKSVQSF